MVTEVTMAPPDTELEQMTPDELKAWRQRHQLSQPQAAAWLEIAVGTLRNYEQGIRKIPPFAWRALRDISAAIDRGEQPPPSREGSSPRQSEPPAGE